MSIVTYYTPFDSYFYSRPISYHSYRGRIQKPDVLARVFATDHLDKIKNLLKRFGFTWNETDSLSRNLRFDDIEIGRRRWDHYHTQDHEAEWYIHQWKPTNDLTVEHPTGTHEVFPSFDALLQELERILAEKKRTKI